MDLLIYRAGGTLCPRPLQLGSSKTCIQKNVTCEFLVFSKCTHTESNCNKIPLSILNFTLMSLYEMTYFVEYFPSCFATKNVVSFLGSFCHRKLMESEEGDLIYPRISCPRSNKKDKQRIKNATNLLMSEIRDFYSYSFLANSTDLAKSVRQNPGSWRGKDTKII